jgi:phosphoadenosine phosphosulfate reductase
MLIRDTRQTPEDLERWAHVERVASVNVSLKRYRSNVTRAVTSLTGFTGSGSCYCGVSWGKDSVVVADLVARNCPRIPLVWVRVTPCENPDCVRVRDEFLKARPSCNYHELEVKAPRDELGYVLRGTLEQGFSEAARRFGVRHISGIRGDESANRARRMAHWGESTKNTCAPIGKWDGTDVFTYLISNGLPIHPAYAFTRNGILDPQRIRVAVIGCRDTDDERGRRGDGWGRHEREQQYYSDHIRKVIRQRTTAKRQVAH